jgi:hypothetical protein
MNMHGQKHQLVEMALTRKVGMERISKNNKDKTAKGFAVLILD